MCSAANDDPAWRLLFTPLARIKKKDLGPQPLRLLRKMSKLKNAKICVEKQNHFCITGGDQVAERIAGIGKQTLRRLGQLGGNKDRLEHRNILAAYYVH